jgi:hypothetical protein
MVVKASIRLAAMLVSAAVASAALVTGCASAGTPQAAVTSGFSAMGLAFRYPGTWRSGTWNDDVSSFSGLIVSSWARAGSTTRASRPSGPK